MRTALGHKGLRGLFMTVPTARLCFFDEERKCLDYRYAFVLVSYGGTGPGLRCGREHHSG